MTDRPNLAALVGAWLDHPGPLERSGYISLRHGGSCFEATDTVFGTTDHRAGVLLLHSVSGQVLGNADVSQWLPQDVWTLLSARGVVLLPFRSLRQARVPLPTSIGDWLEDVEVVDREGTCPAGDGETFSGAVLLRSRRTFLLLDSEGAHRSAAMALVPYLVRLPRGSRPASIAEARDLLLPDLARSARANGLRMRRLGTWHFVPEREMVVSEPPGDVLERLKAKPHPLGYGIPRRLLSGTGMPWDERTVKREYGKAYRRFLRDLKVWEKAREKLQAMLPVANGRLDPDGSNDLVVWADEVLGRVRGKSFVRGKVTLSSSFRSVSLDLDGWHRVVRVEGARIFPAKGAVLTTEAPLATHAATG